MQKLSHVVFIGRFEPFHLGHNMILQEGLTLAEKVIVVLGSHKKAPTSKNPWTSDEREQMIRVTLTPEQNARVEFIPIRDYLYQENNWIVEIQQKVADYTEYSDNVKLIGHKSDRSSYYMNLFPQWGEPIDFKTDVPTHATDIRNLYFTLDAGFKKFVHPKTAEFMVEFQKTAQFERLKAEFDHINQYKEEWRGAPFSPTFVTTDAIVIKSGHVLVVRRKGALGKGLIALPGGFLNQHEFIVDGCVRELREETGIKVNAADLMKSIEGEHVFDAPGRSLRGRTITHGFYFDLGSGLLPMVKGADDADKAWWMPLSEFQTREEEFFEDHFHVVNFFTQGGRSYRR
jgi:bifunctional NMN adenylyltransferase/nudix hydrolase